MLPPSPLEAFRRGIGQVLRTGLSPTFEASTATSTVAAAVRRECRAGALTGPTVGLAPGHAQANLVCVPKEHAFDFARFCLLNPRPCPLLAIASTPTDLPPALATGADLARDLPRYRVWRDGVPADDVTDASHVWTGDNLTGFLLGCSFSWEQALADAGHPPWHFVDGTNVSMYVTDVPNAVSGPFGGKLVVSMRPYAPEAVPAVAALTGAYPAAHGGPIHWGDSALLGIADLAKPTFGDAVRVEPGEVPVFWACGVTPQSALKEAALPLCVTHAPGHMFVCDLTDEALRVWPL